MVWAFRDRCAIAGIGHTEFSKKSGRSVLALALEASLAAIADAGMSVDDIDGIVRCDLDSLQHNDLAHALGLPNLTFWGTVGVGGGAPCGMVGQAVAAVLSGQANAVLLFRALNGRSGVRYGHGAAVAPAVGGNGSLDEFFLPYGMLSPGQMYGMIARRHMEEFGTTSDHLGHIAVACRNRANTNPNAQMHDRTLSMDDYRAGRMISDPLRIFDFCQETDGACAVVVASVERAAYGPHPPAVIRAVAQGGIDDLQGGILFPALMRPTLTTQPSDNVARTLYSRAALGPADIDVAQVYDCFTITVLLQLEDYGFCAKGDGGPFAASGALELGGALPINTAGGNLSEGYIHGLNHVVEGVKQVRGTSTAQVRDAEVCLVTSGIPVSTSAMILTRGAA